MRYSAPSVTDLGSVRDLTLVVNKVGSDPDIYSGIVPVVGSIIPLG